MENFFVYFLPGDVQGQNTLGIKNSRLFVAWLCSLEKLHHESPIFPTPKLPGSQEPTSAIKHKAIKFCFQKTPAIFSTCISLHPTQRAAKTTHGGGKEPGHHIMFCTVLRRGRGWGRGCPGTRDGFWPFFFKEKQNSVNNPGTGRRVLVLGHAQRSCTGSGVTLPRTQQLLRPQHPGFSWGLTWAPWGSSMGSFPWSRKALYLCPEPLQPARVSLAKQDGVHSTCEHRQNSLWEMSGLVFLWLVSAVMNNTPPAAGWEPGFPELWPQLSLGLAKGPLQLLNPLPQSPYLDKTDMKHLGACECPKWHSRLSWKRHLVHQQPPERFNPEHTIPGSCPSLLLTKIYLL